MKRKNVSMFGIIALVNSFKCLHLSYRWPFNVFCECVLRKATNGIIRLLFCVHTLWIRLLRALSYMCSTILDRYKATWFIILIKRDRFCFTEFDVVENYANLIGDYRERPANLTWIHSFNFILATIHSVFCSFISCVSLRCSFLLIFSSIMFTFDLGNKTLNCRILAKKNQFSKSS